MEIGIIGLPGCGKTTLLNALAGAHAQTGAFGAHRPPNLGVVKVPDARLRSLVDAVRPERVVQAEITFVDIPGQSPEMGHSEGFKGEYLLAVSQVDELLLVLRAFTSPLLSDPNPEDDLSAMELEMTFADLGIVDRRLQRLADMMKSAKTDERVSIERESSLLRRMKGVLEEGAPIRSMELSEAERRSISGFTFLTTKPLIVVLNVDEDGISSMGQMSERWTESHRGRIAGCIALPVRLEEELSDLAADEAIAFRESMNLPANTTGDLIQLAERAAGMITFYTAGPSEVRAWQVEADTPAPRVAGKKIHSDLERGFIRAETIRLADFLDAGSFVEARKRGTLRQEGKEYRIQDGDLVTFLFNVSGR